MHCGHWESQREPEAGNVGLYAEGYEEYKGQNQPQVSRAVVSSTGSGYWAVFSGMKS